MGSSLSRSSSGVSSLGSGMGVQLRRRRGPRRADSPSATASFRGILIHTVGWMWYMDGAGGGLETRKISS